jgi:hypothetical protein
MARPATTPNETALPRFDGSSPLQFNLPGSDGRLTLDAQDDILPRPETDMGSMAGQAQRLACGQIRQPARDGSLSVRCVALSGQRRAPTDTTPNPKPVASRHQARRARSLQPVPPLPKKSRLQRPGVGNGSWVNQSTNPSISDMTTHRFRPLPQTDLGRLTDTANNARQCRNAARQVPTGQEVEPLVPRAAGPNRRNPRG